MWLYIPTGGTFTVRLLLVCPQVSPTQAAMWNVYCSPDRRLDLV